MSGNRLRFLVVSSLAALTLFAAACGGNDNSSSTSSKTAAAAPAGGTPDTTAGKKGGKLTMLAASDVDYLDPGHTYYTAGEQVDGAMGRTLYTIGPKDPTKTVPDIADGEPQISADKKTVTVKIKPGIKFSPPVNRAVTSKDIKYAFERFFSVNVGGQYASYFPIVGAPKAPTKGVKPISGITTPDDQTIVFKLQDAVAVSFAAALVMPITTPVPEEYAKPFDAKNPSTYNTHVVASGPYMVKNDAKGNLIGYKAGKSIDLVRNPNWDPKTDDRPAYLDEIFIQTNASDANVSSKQVIAGKNLILDTNPPAAILKELVTKVKDQYTTVPSGGFRSTPRSSRSTTSTSARPFWRASTATRPGWRVAASSPVTCRRTSCPRSSPASPRRAGSTAPATTS
jgi:peptide/nickel transport system substrate-binding protein